MNVNPSVADELGLAALDVSMSMSTGTNLRVGTGGSVNMSLRVGGMPLNPKTR